MDQTAMGVVSLVVSGGYSLVAVADLLLQGTLVAVHRL